MAWLLMLFPIAEEWQWLRPQWLFLVVIYWLLTRPEVMGIGGAWIAGLMMDILSGGLLGKYALGTLVVAYLARSLRYRLRIYPIWQQSVAILLMVGIGNIALFLIEWLTGHPPTTALYWLPILSSVAVWPWFYRLLQLYEKKLI
jgi:rod shape-determining protein MreD